MLEHNPIALKEWAIVVWAMGQGLQTFLLRKGGIAEQGEQFRLAAREFFLYPTYEHQQADLLQAEFLAAFRRLAPGHSDNGDLALQYYAAVTDILPAPDLSRMKQLRDAFVWNDAFLEKRYSYKPSVPLYALLLRTYRLPHPIRLPQRERYAGCRSWVELEESPSTKGALPVLEEEQFQRRREFLRRRFTATAGNRMSAMSDGSTAIIIFAHGSAVPEANRQIARLAEEVARRARCPVGCAFLEMAPPDLEQAVAQTAAAGARRIVVIPYFLAMGVHVREDLPRLIERQRALFPAVEIRVGQSLDSYPGMAEVILDRARATLPDG